MEEELENEIENKDPLAEMLDLDVEEDADVEELDDGGALVTMGVEVKIQNEFYENLAEILPESGMDDLANDLMLAIQRDKESREDRDKQYEEGLKRTGLGNDAPGGADFTGASRVVHPILTEVAIDFSARAMKELFPRSGPDSGPVKDQIIGEPTAEKIEKAKRKSRYMNWQVTRQMPEFRSELEQMMTQVPLGGAQYLKLTWDRRLKRPKGYFIPIDDVYLPWAATSFYSAERQTHRQKITRLEYDRRVATGLYRDLDLAQASNPQQSKAEQANDKIEGRKQSDAYDDDDLRTVYEIYVECEIEEDNFTDGEIAPYIITIDESTQKILGFYRNWDQEDERRIGLDWIVEFPFVPWRGAYPIGIPQMIGGLSASMTGSLRALLDSAMIQNMPTALKLKGGSKGGQSLQMNPTQITEIEGTPNNDDIRKTVMQLPFSGPSPVLYQLLGFLQESAKGVVRTTFEDISDSPANMPVGTTLALIEQGMTVFNAIHARLHDSMGRVFSILHRLNATYLDEEDLYDDVGELLAKREDFEGPCDVVPVSDPNIFSEMQRLAQVQIVEQRAAAMPQLYDQRKVEELILSRTKIPDAKDLLIPIPEPQRLNAVNENVAATMGRPLIAFPDQDHLAHIKVHLDYMTNPVLGGNPIITPVIVPTMMTHLKDHVALWYVNEVVRIASQAAGQDITALMDPKDPLVDQEFDRVLAMASDTVGQIAQSSQLIAALPAVVQQAMQMMAALQNKPMDAGQVAMETLKAQQAETARKAQYDQAKMALEQQKLTNDVQTKAMETAAKERINREDNETAMLIAASEIEAGNKTNLRTGTGLGK
jgi:hypothetical protein